MIRFADKEDITEIKKLWNESFGNDDFAEWFFENEFKIDNVLVYEINTSIVAMLQRIPYEINNIGSVTYIYGACTTKAHRKKGVMTQLLKYSEQLDIKLDKKAIFLVPENEKLFGFYEKQGYNQYFYKYQLDDTVFIEEKNLYKKQNNIAIQDIVSNSDYSKLAKNMLNLYNESNKNTNYIIRTQEMFEKQIDLHLNTNGKVSVIYKKNRLIGYIFGYIENEKYQITELLIINDIYYTEVKRLLLTQYKCVNILNYFKGNVKIKYGCIKMLQKILNINKIIINLVFD